ncbi:MAG: hypothetical protein Q9M97_07360 [Candidatus Gracilibacteria bacterium]|nr:hypothetical protein [Candidatus Gracilibacteria bacterium]
MKFEKSSGGVVYRKRLKNRNFTFEMDKILEMKMNMFCLSEKLKKMKLLKIQPLREIGEEAGLYESDLEVIKFITKLNYTFCASYLPGRPFIDKDVYLFLVKYNGSREPTPRIEERFTGYDWINIRDISKLSLKFDLTGIVSRNKTYFI